MPTRRAVFLAAIFLATAATAASPRADDEDNTCSANVQHAQGSSLVQLQNVMAIAQKVLNVGALSEDEESVQPDMVGDAAFEEDPVDSSKLPLNEKEDELERVMISQQNHLLDTHSHGKDPAQSPKLSLDDQEDHLERTRSSHQSHPHKDSHLSLLETGATTIPTMELPVEDLVEKTSEGVAADALPPSHDLATASSTPRQSERLDVGEEQSHRWIPPRLVLEPKESERAANRWAGIFAQMSSVLAGHRFASNTVVLAQDLASHTMAQLHKAATGGHASFIGILATALIMCCGFGAAFLLLLSPSGNDDRLMKDSQRGKSDFAALVPGLSKPVTAASLTSARLSNSVPQPLNKDFIRSASSARLQTLELQHLCPCLVVPDQCESVLAVPIESLLQTRGQDCFDVRDMSGHVLLRLKGRSRLQHAPPYQNTRPGFVEHFQLAIPEADLLARCYGPADVLQDGAARGSGAWEFHLARPDGSHFGKLQEQEAGRRHLLMMADGRQIHFLSATRPQGAVEYFAMNVTDESGILRATVEPRKPPFATQGEGYYELRVAPNTDVGLLLCCSYCINHHGSSWARSASTPLATPLESRRIVRGQL